MNILSNMRRRSILLSVLSLVFCVPVLLSSAVLFSMPLKAARIVHDDLSDIIPWIDTDEYDGYLCFYGLDQLLEYDYPDVTYDPVVYYTYNGSKTVFWEGTDLDSDIQYISPYGIPNGAVIYVEYYTSSAIYRSSGFTFLYGDHLPSSPLSKNGYYLMVGYPSSSFATLMHLSAWDYTIYNNQSSSVFSGSFEDEDYYLPSNNGIFKCYTRYRDLNGKYYYSSSYTSYSWVNTASSFTLTYKDGYITWAPIPGVTYYEVYLDSNMINRVTDTYLIPSRLGRYFLRASDGSYSSPIVVSESPFIPPSEETYDDAPYIEEVGSFFNWFYGFWDFSKGFGAHIVVLVGIVASFIATKFFIFGTR